MMATRSFSRDLQIATTDISPRSMAPALAAFARSELAAAIASGVASKVYDRYVNGRLGASEDSVTMPGPIEYEFSIWPDVIEFTLQALVERSPERSGRYKRAWFVMTAGGRVRDISDIPNGADVTFCNDEPYSRKIDVGHMHMSVPPGVVEDVRKMVLAQFGNMISARRTMIPLPSGYVLKGHFTRGVGRFARTRLRRDTAAGQQMLYPALVLSLRGA
jgi:hypothetical protein